MSGNFFYFSRSNLKEKKIKRVLQVRPPISNYNPKKTENLLVSMRTIPTNIFISFREHELSDIFLRFHIQLDPKSNSLFQLQF